MTEINEANNSSQNRENAEIENIDEENTVSVKEDDDDKGEKFPIVGLGASAGGLEALKAFFSNISENSGMAYIVVSHMKPDQPSLLPELLQKSTSIPVSTAQDGCEITPDHVYVIAPNKEIGVLYGKIRLTDPSERRSKLIDLFFRSLAKERENRAVAIVLSGTGTDGSIGIKDIKDKEGLVFVQSEKSAQYGGMPRSAIETGIVDAVLSPEEMPKTLGLFFMNHGAASKKRMQEESKSVRNWLEKIFAIIQSEVGHDFSLYKTNTLLRRIGRRMTLNQIENKEKYIDYLKVNPAETRSLFQEMLIGVTNFFRDPESFRTLQCDILPGTLKSMEKDEIFRLWVPGCSTGEDVYSLAMVLNECIEEQSSHVGIQLFGTDVDGRAVEKAREGIYPSSIEADVSEERLNRFFYKEGETYRIRREIRDCAVFSVHDVLKDPPFSRLNLLCCRNLLIYLDTQAQKKLLPLFHYTLKHDGILMLGSSESLGPAHEMFDTLDKKWKIFRRREISRSRKIAIDFPSGSPRDADQIETDKVCKTFKDDLGQLTREALLDQYTPTAVLVDSKGNIAHVQGRTGKYLETTSGPPTNNIVDMARQGLRVELSAALRAARSSTGQVTRKRVRVKTNGDDQTINLHVTPQAEPKPLRGRFLVVFEDVEDPAEGRPEKNGHFADKSSGMAELEKELLRTRESHQTTVEELESSNEELRSTNEELQSSNEELQSINEELESSKEELQSLNEELQTMNSELENNLDELSRAHDDMRNLLNSTEIATIFVDNDHRVRRFTPDATKLINLIQTDIGRPLKHVATNLENDEMMDELVHALEEPKTREKEVRTQSGEWFKMRIMPYRTTKNKIDGAVITFNSIDDQKKGLLLIRQVFDMNPGPLAVLDREGRLVIANDSFGELLKIGKKNVEGEDVLSLVHGIPEKTDLKKKLKQALDSGMEFESAAFDLDGGAGEKKYRIKGQILPEADELPYRILLSFNEI